MEDPQFGTWVSTQRWCYNKNVLNPNRLALLNSIGFKWVADNNGAINNAAKKRKQQKAETERRIAEKEKIQDDKRAKKAEVVAERKEKKSKRAEEKEQKVSQCNTHYCSECLCIICIILQSILYSNPYFISILLLLLLFPRNKPKPWSGRN